MTLLDLMNNIRKYDALKKNLERLESFKFSSDYWEDSFELEQRLSKHNALINNTKESILELEKQEIK